jgi:GT2 family glycosyltransferase
LVVLNYNGREVILDCLQSLFDSDYEPFEVILVDNNSSDGSAKLAKNRFPDIRLITLKRNLGFSIGNNLGIYNSVGDFIILLNYDTCMEKTCIRKLIEVAKKQKAAFYQPKILLYDNVKLLNSAGNMITFGGFTVMRGINEPETLYQNVDCVGYASGACVMFPRKTIEKVGYLDPIYFAYKEDLDWGWRARLMGLRSLFVPSAVIYHRWGSSSNLPRKIFFSERNRIITLLKNYSKRTLILLFPYLLLIEISTICFCISRGLLHKKIRAYSDILKLKSYIRKKRLLIQKKRKKSDRFVTSLFVSNFSHPFLSQANEKINKILENFGDLFSHFI